MSTTLYNNTSGNLNSVTSQACAACQPCGTLAGGHLKVGITDVEFLSAKKSVMRKHLMFWCLSLIFSSLCNFQGYFHNASKCRRDFTLIRKVALHPPSIKPAGLRNYHWELTALEKIVNRKKLNTTISLWFSFCVEIWRKRNSKP